MTALVFMDTETTGLSLDDDIWEFAAIRREEDGAEVAVHLFIQHDSDKCARLPEPFLSDHRARYDGDEGWVTREVAAIAIETILQGRPHVVGAVPNFDTERLALLLRAHGREPSWHYHLIDVENLAVGWLQGRYGPRDGGPPVEAEGQAVSLPWDSDALSLAVGVDPQRFDRHTALGDVRWAMAIYDAVTGAAS